MILLLGYPQPVFLATLFIGALIVWRHRSNIRRLLEGTENRISVARTRYNESVKTLNTFAREFFGRYFCDKAGVEKYSAKLARPTKLPSLSLTLLDIMK